jgi:hypothetical protein
VCEEEIMDGTTVGLLGGGQLGRMMVEAGHRLGIRVAVLDPGTTLALLLVCMDTHVCVWLTSICVIFQREVYPPQDSCPSSPLKEVISTKQKSSTNSVIVIMNSFLYCSMLFSQRISHHL